MYIEVSLDCSAFQSIPERLWPDRWDMVCEVTLSGDDAVDDVGLPAVYAVRDGKPSTVPLPLSILTAEEQNYLIDCAWDAAKESLSLGLDNPGDEYDPDGGLR